MKRCVVNVATGDYVLGQLRLRASLKGQAEFVGFRNRMPPGSPSHERVPYAFKAYALEQARSLGFETLLWADASVLPIRPMDDLWRLIETDGYWFSRNGWTNGEWCADSALPKLGISREEANRQDHVVATAFGLNLLVPAGRGFLDQYMAFANNGAFCGPWWNSNHPSYRNDRRAQACGDATVRGHRHDQTAASAIVAKLGFKCTNPPKWFAYRGGETAETVLVVDSSYNK